MTVKPIKASEVFCHKPDEVYVAFNTLIKEHWNGQQACFLQDDVLTLISEATGTTREDIFDKHWLDIELDYKESGWLVKYDKPNRGQNFRPFFTFEKITP